MKSDKTIRYNCRYKKQVWKCEIRNIKKINEITSFSISGRKSRYDIYLIQLGQERWIGILLNRKFSTKKIIQKLQIKKTNGLRKMPFQTALHQP